MRVDGMIDGRTFWLVKHSYPYPILAPDGDQIMAVLTYSRTRKVSTDDIQYVHDKTH